MIRRFLAVAFGSCVLLSPAALCQDSAKAGELLDAVARTLADAPAIGFQSEIRTKIESLEVTQKAAVILKRPDLARLELSGGGQDALLVLDGSTSWHHLKGRNRYVKSQQIGTIKIEQYGVGPLAILFFEKSSKSLAPYLADATVTREKHGGDECSVISWKIGAEETRIWVCGARLGRYTIARSIDGKRFEQAFEYGVVDLAPAVSDALFTFTPPAGSEQLPAGDDSKLLAVGAVAPEFTATRLDGVPITLADVKGKTVVMSFWFYACATCREEFRRLQRIQAEHAKQGVVILAVNFGDSPEAVRAYFEKEKFSFTAVMQKGKEVSTAFGVRAYPTNYVIGPDGKVAWRAVGFDPKSIEAALDGAAAPK